ncbi:hypothetical protein, partial [Staphylococcus capitis]
MFVSQYAIGFEAHLEMVLQNLIALAGARQRNQYLLISVSLPIALRTTNLHFVKEVSSRFTIALAIALRTTNLHFVKEVSSRFTIALAIALRTTNLHFVKEV